MHQQLQLIEAENRYSRVLENLPVAIYSCDAEGFITEYNAAAAALWGRSPEIREARWCGAPKIFHPDGHVMDHDCSPPAITLKEGRAVAPEELIIEREDGTRRWVLAHSVPVFNKEQELVGAVSMLQDITGQKQSEEKSAYLAAIIESSDDAIISKTPEGIVTGWNSAATRIFGYTAEEMIGQPILRIIPEDRQGEEPLILARLRNGERVDHFETKRLTKDGRLVDISLTISPIIDSAGRVIGVSKVARDITGQRITDRLVRESEERFRMAVSATGLGTWEYTPKNDSMVWSDECRSIYQVPPQLPIDVDLFRRLAHGEDIDITMDAVNAAMDPSGSGDYDVVFRILRYSDGAVRWVRSQGKVFFDDAGQAENFIGTVLDITEEKLEKEALEKEVQERTRELTEANIRLGESNKELEQFAFVASHDLQEPLRKIQAFGDMLKARMPAGTADDAMDIVARMQESAKRMKMLIDSLLSFSRVSAPDKSAHVPVDLNGLLREVLSDLETAVREKDAAVNIAPLLPVRGEPMQLRQLFQNLIGNALKFTQAGRRPEVTVTAQQVKGSEANMDILPQAADALFQLIEIRDNGIGFDPAYSNRIFQLFQRLHGKSEYPGSGMGLSIAKKVVINHHGFISAGSTPGEGSVFRILLPLEA